MVSPPNNTLAASLYSMAKFNEISPVQSHSFLFYDKCNEHLDQTLVHAFAILCRVGYKRKWCSIWQINQCLPSISLHKTLPHNRITTIKEVKSSINQPINQPTNQPINQSINQSIKQASKQAIKQSINQSVNFTKVSEGGISLAS